MNNIEFYIFVFMIMIFMHIFADFILQTKLMGNIKQKSWWKENYPDNKYRNDYIIGLIIHSYSWSFLVYLPLLIIKIDISLFVVIILINTIIHSMIDDLKCNDLLLNLTQDQIFHIIQIILFGTMYIIR